MTAALQARALHVGLGHGAHRVEAVRGVDVAIPASRWTSVVGPNGAGKSTLLRALGGLVPFRGSVELLGQSLGAYGPRQRARRMAWLGQNERAGDDLTAWDVAMLGRLPHQRWLAVPTTQDRAIVEEALRATQAWDWRARRLGELSGGERQRVLLARALAVRAPVLLMDEPLANLDPPHQADWIAIVRGLVAEGCTVVSVLHEATIALQADDMVVVSEGRVQHHGPCADTTTHRALEEVFAGRLRVHTVAGQHVALPAIPVLPA